MYHFQRRAPLDLATYPEPAAADRAGPPLSQGFVLTLISTVAAEYCSADTLAKLAEVNPTAWYDGQVLESILNEFEDQDPELPAEVGMNIYYTLRSQFVSMGLSTPEDVVRTLPMIWQHVTRGDSGEWRNTMLGPGRAHIELEQPYNCRFEQGALRGALEAFDASDVAIEHTQCMRDGADYCVLEVEWQ